MFGRTSAGIMSRFIIFWKSLINISDLEQKFDFYTLYEIPIRTKKKVHQNIEIAFNFTWKILYKLIGSRKIRREFPLNLIWVQFTGKSFVFFSTFSMISKKSNLEGVFEFFYSDPQLDPNFKPTRNLSGQLLYIYLCIYICLLFNIS